MGSLLYLTPTRLDLMFTTGLLSRFMTKPSNIHTETAKRVLRYLKGTSKFGVMLVGSIDDMKITCSYVFRLGSGMFT